MFFISKRVKTITTIGPASESKEVMLGLAKKGANVYRLNFSHGDFEEHGKRIETARAIIESTKRPFSILLDTKGPEIRTHSFTGGQAKITKDSEIIIHTNQEITANENEFSINYDNLINDIQVGQRLLVDDGKLQLIVETINPDTHQIVTKAVNTHVVKDRRAIIVPGVKLSLPFISEKDREDILFGIKMNVDYIGASFVSDATDVNEMRQFLDNNGGSHIKIVSKIESNLALKHLDEIITASDAIMVARGDLGVDIPYCDVPLWEKRIIRKCNKEMVPVIVATQMLESMITNPMPTRAEVSDIYWSVDLGADCTMLSGETANGEYPRKAMEAMSRVIRSAERHFWHAGYLDRFHKNSQSAFKDLVFEIGKEVLNRKIHKIIVLDDTDNHLLTKTLSNARVRSTLISLITDEKEVGGFGIWYGVYPELVTNLNDVSDDVLETIARKYDAKNEQVLIVDRNGYRELHIN